MTDVAEQLTEAFIAPIRDVGTLLATQIDLLRDDVDTDLAAMRGTLAELRGELLNLRRLVHARTDNLA